MYRRTATQGTQQMFDATGTVRASALCQVCPSVAAMTKGNDAKKPNASIWRQAAAPPLRKG